jgi:thioester reductase-like protein
MSDALLLTGSTGFIGMGVLARYLERTDRRVYAPIRADSQAHAEQRINGAIRGLFSRRGEEEGSLFRSYAERVVAVPMDLRSRRLALAERQRDWLAESVGDVIHCAASVSFAGPIAEQRAINVEGTRRVLELAESCARRGGLRRFSYVSTAYVAGDHAGKFGEGDLNVGQGFRNSYERSKFEAEQLVRSRAADLPIDILRPSVVVGERASGWTNSFNVVYWPLRAFRLGTYSVLPVRRSSPVDIVPSDYVADAIVALAERPSGSGETHHLTAGDDAPSVGTLLDITAARLRARPPRVIPPWPYRKLVHPFLMRRAKGPRRVALRQSEAYFPYFSMRLKFADRHTRRRLEPIGIRYERVERYFDRLIDFALTTRFGRSPMTRADALAWAQARGSRDGASPV